MEEMSMVPGICEIVELADSDSRSVFRSRSRKDIISKDDKRCAMEEDINRLFEAIIRASGKESGQQVSREALLKKAMKKPVRAGSSLSSSTGVSAPVSLKQALRGICISHASELAAMRRLSKPENPGLSGVLEVKSVGKNYTAMRSLENNECSYPVRDSEENIVEVSLVPEVNMSSRTVNLLIRFPITSVLDPSASTSASAYATMSKVKMGEKLRQLGKAKIRAEADTRKPNMDLGQNGRLRTAGASYTVVTNEKVSSDGIVPWSIRTASDKDCGSELQSAPKSSIQCEKNELPSKSAQLIKTFLWNKNKLRKKLEMDPCSSSNSCSFRPNVEVNSVPNVDDVPYETHRYTPNSNEAVSVCPVLNDAKHQVEDSFDILHPNANCVARLKSAKSRSKGIGDFSQSSKSSIGDFSCSTSISEDSIFSRSSLSGCRPHMSNDLRWEAIHHVQKLYGSLSSSHFKLLKKLGCGDIGTVYLAELRSTNSLFAIKVMDNEFLISMNKMPRAQTEREIMQMLDHPFVPTLYAYFTTDKFSCLVMEYCRGGDLQVLRQKQFGRCFSEQAARFYGAEILLALEYLHLQGVVYRDLKPENILVREDGHIMLTDFDLSLRCSVYPTLVKSLSGPASTSLKMTVPSTTSTCMDPFCIQPTWQAPCFTLKTSSSARKTKNLKSDPAVQVSSLPQLVVEPTNARSNSFVGTHEYLAPEIIKGEGHGSAVDWWTFGIFMYELQYGKTPFKGQTNGDTLANVVSQPLTFPQTPIVSFHARDLIRRLLTKEPADRLGSLMGAAEIKQHSFFQGLNWALVRCATPPEFTSLDDTESLTDKRNLPKELFEQF